MRYILITKKKERKKTKSLFNVFKNNLNVENLLNSF